MASFITMGPGVNRIGLMTEQPDHRVNLIGQPESVPVFDCPVLVARVSGHYVARSASLAGVSGQGATEREALQKIVAAFKAEVQQYTAADEIPFIVPNLEPTGEEELRLLAVHL